MPLHAINQSSYSDVYANIALTKDKWKWQVQRLATVAVTCVFAQLQCCKSRQCKRTLSLSFPSRAKCYKTFYARNLQRFVMRWSVGPWQAFTA